MLCGLLEQGELKLHMVVFGVYACLIYETHSLHAILITVIIMQMLFCSHVFVEDREYCRFFFVLSVQCGADIIKFFLPTSVGILSYWLQSN